MEQGRFGEFVTEILSAEKQRKEELQKKEEDEKWWSLYLHSYSDKSFSQWKSEVTSGSGEHKKEARTSTKPEEDVDAMVQRLFSHT